MSEKVKIVKLIMLPLKIAMTNTNTTSNTSTKTNTNTNTSEGSAGNMNTEQYTTQFVMYSARQPHKLY